VGRAISWRFHRYTAYGTRVAYRPGPADAPGEESGTGENSPKRLSKEEIERIIARYVKKPEQQR
jgi:2,4-dienoyl-CoA reductase-like NADH-dependent reductase (Old Yellow Enzyme family)